VNKKRVARRSIKDSCLVVLKENEKAKASMISTTILYDVGQVSLITIAALHMVVIVLCGHNAVTLGQDRLPSPFTI